MYGYRRTAAPLILNLEHALKTYHNIHPIRGRSQDTRPFARRSDDTRTIRLNADGTVSCRLHRTDVITYHEDKVEVMLDGYMTKSTAAFLNDVLPLNFCIFDYKIWVYCLSVDNMGKAGYYPLDKRGSNYFIKDSQDAFTILQNPKYPVTHRVIRKEANNVRQSYATFKQYVINMFKLRDEVTPQEYGEVFGWHSDDLPCRPNRLVVREWIQINDQDLKEFFTLAVSPEPEDQYRAYLWLLCDQAGGLRTNWGGARVCLKTALLELDKLILKYHRYECFKAVERRDLVLCKDSNADYF